MKKLLLLFLLLTRPLSATVHNVSTAGALNTALTTAVAGDEIIVANGTYTGTFNLTTNSGTSSSPITLRAENLHGAIIDGTGLTQDGNLTYNAGFHITKNWWIIHGFILKEHQIAINIAEVGATSHNLEIRHNLIHDFRHAAVKVGSSNNYIHHNVMGISDAVPLFSTSPFVVYGASLTTDNRIIDNIIYSQSNDGYLIPNAGSHGGGVWGSGDNNAWLVQGNLFMDLNRTCGSRFFSLQHIQPSTNNVTRDNISIHATAGSLGSGENEDDGTIANNIIYGGFINPIGAKGNDPGRNDILHNSIFLTQFSFNGLYMSTAPDQLGGPAVSSKATIVKDNLFYSTLANAATGMFQQHALFDVYFDWAGTIAESNYNLFWRPGTDSGATAWNTGVTYGANDIHSATEPSFVDAATGDFTLAAGSSGKGSASDGTDRGAIFNSYLKKSWFQNAFALPTQETATGGGLSLSFTTSAANQYQVFSYTPDTGYYVGVVNFVVEGKTMPRDFAQIDDWYLGVAPRRWIYLGTHSNDGTLNVSWSQANGTNKIFIRQMPTVLEAYGWMTEVPPGSAEASFAARCVAPGVIKCESFDNATTFTPTTGPIGLHDVSPKAAFQDTSIKSSGASSVRFDILGNTPANAAGDFVASFSPMMGQNTTFYVQYQLRMDAQFVNYDWNLTGSGTAPKQMIVHGANSTCQETQIVTTAYNFNLSPNKPVMYSECGNRSMYTNLAGTAWQESPPMLIQQPENATSGYKCQYGTYTVGTGGGTGCFAPTPDVFMTYYYKISIGTWGAANSTVDAFVAVNGGSYKQWVKAPNYTFFNPSGAGNNFSRIMLTPYMTGKSAAVAHPTARVWYDELIISTQPILAPQLPTAYYISPSGSDANSCIASKTSTTPKKTFTSAIACLGAGDTLILRNGTYSSSAGTGYLNINGKNGTAALPITIKAENERQAFIDGNGSNPFVVLNSSYLVFEGIRVKNLDDDVNPAYGGQVIYVQNSNNLTFRRMLVTNNNRCYNGSIFVFETVSNSLVEDNEVYSFHRNGLGGYQLNGNVFRRNYLNSRNYADIAAGGVCGANPGWASDPTTKGDGGLITYPGSNNIWENNIVENTGSGVDIQASEPTIGNKFYGNMAVSCDRSINATARGSTLTLMPRDTTIQNFVSVGATSVGVYLRSTKNTIFKQGTIIGGTGVHGFAADKPGSLPGDGAPSVFLTNVNSSGNVGTGFYVDQQSSWLLNYVNSFGNTTAFTPLATDPNITNETTTDPALGSCKAWIPSTSPMKGTGENGIDKGANVLYQYQNGVLTGTKLWDTTTNNFTGCGVVVAGVNDIAGSSCTNVDIRLNIGAANGCAFPAGYGVPGSPGGDWISIDNFDSYTIGNSLSAGAGGSGWSGNWTEGTAAVTVGTAPAGGQGGGAFFVNADPNFSAYRPLSDLSAGILSFKFYITSATPADAIFILLDEATTSRGLISIDPDSNVKIFNGTARTNIGAYTANAWHTVTIEFDDAAQPNAFRAKLNAGVFSQWQPAANGGTYSVVNRLRIQPEGTTLFNAQLYIDDIREGSTSSVVSTISLVDAGLTGVAMFVGETKPLQWSTTDYTGNIDLLASRDGGATFQPIAQGVPNTGTYNWSVTGPATSQAKIKPCLSSQPSICDTSLVFGIGGTLLTVR